MGISKKQCLEAWLDEIRPFGDVLEIGSGPPLPSIRAFHLKSYTRINLEKEPWQTALPPLGSFDFILYNDKVIERAHVETGNLLLQEGKKALQKVREAVPELAQIRYSDRDLDAFSQQIHEAQKPYLSRFLAELLENGQITEAQQQRQIEKYHLKKTKAHKPVLEDHLFECIQECLKHMWKGSRFSCLIGVTSKYEDPQFFEHIIANPSLDYQEKPVGNSNYMLIEVG
ncbi:MAG TPA: hypothetical protein VHL30_02405 [Chlamydiales bacterium]|jgi:hypothetical protein|nr:hypothetical protein [Chlamydiales bacterium]